MKTKLGKIFLGIVLVLQQQGVIGEEKKENNLLKWEAWSGFDEAGNPVKVYRPYPVIFVHGFAKGGPQTWNEVLSDVGVRYAGLNYHFAPYQKYELNLGMQNYKDFRNLVDPSDPKYLDDNGKPTVSPRSPYLERVDMRDKNGSIDTYNEGDEITLENPQGTTDGWADKLARSVHAALKDSDSKKAILVGHSMGGLAAREMVTGANGPHGVDSHQIDKIITIDTPHAGTPLAEIASGLGNVYRHGWMFPGIGWVLAIW